MREMQFDNHASADRRKKGDVQSTADSAVKRSASTTNTSVTTTSGRCAPKIQRVTCESFAEDLIDTEDFEFEGVEEEVEDEEEEDGDVDDDDNNSMYDFESRMEKAKYWANRKRRFSSTSAKKRSSEYALSKPNRVAVVTKFAPFWKSKAIVNGHVSELKLTDYLGRYLVMFFYPQDFSKLCAQEINELSDRICQFRKINAEIVACSVDSHLTHQVWCKMSKSDGGVAYPKVPLLSDCTHAISKAYGCYLPEAGHTLRAHYVIDAKGTLRHATMQDIGLSRDVDEILKLVQLFQRNDECVADADDTIFVETESG